MPSDTTDEDNVDSRAHLGAESTKMSFSFAAQCATKTFLPEKTEPLKEESHSRKIKYCYYLYVVNEGLSTEFHLIVRTEVELAEKAADGSMKPFRAFGLLEFEPVKNVRSYNKPSTTVQWTDSSPIGTILLDVARKNYGKVARWIAMSYLSDAGMKIGFITRKNKEEKSTEKTHAIGSVFSISPTDFARSINLDMSSMWASVSAVVDAILKSRVEVGGVIRQGGEKQLRIFADDLGDGDDDEEDDDSEDDDDDDDDSEDDEDEN